MTKRITINKEYISNSIEKQISASEIINNKLALITRLKRLEQDQSLLNLINILEKEVKFHQENPIEELKAPEETTTLQGDAFTEETEILLRDEIDWIRSVFEEIITNLAVMFPVNSQDKTRRDFHQRVGMLYGLFENDPQDQSRANFIHNINRILKAKGLAPLKTMKEKQW